MNQDQPGVPHWRLSGFYFFYFAILGAMLPYWGLYLQSLGFTPLQIGYLAAITMGTKLFAPFLWGWLGDSIGRRMPVIRLASLLTAIAFAGLLLEPGFRWFFWIIFFYSFFWNASLPQFEVVTLNHLRGQPRLYGRIRLWGSVGFVVAVLLLGPLFERFGLTGLPQVVLGFMLLGWLISLLVPESSGSRHSGSDSAVVAASGWEILGFLLACLFMQASYGPYYTFFSIYLQDYSYSQTSVGFYWALGVVAEIGLFLMLPRLLPLIGVRRLFLLSLVSAAVRWLMIGYFPHFWPVLFVAQLMHGVTFGVYHGAAIVLVHGYFRGRLQGRGQAIYSSFSFGAGGALGGLYSGYFWQQGQALLTHQVAAVLALVGLLLAWIGFSLGQGGWRVTESTEPGG
ncbi:MAG: MFS transporter [Gammaproteobacteria bacterium]|nr:MFS transporter [Gammaproteobacteria bacterium]